MQTQWYGDKRDLVKWAALVHLCRRHGLGTIIQVPFLPNRNGCGCRLFADGTAVEFPAEVWQHFRDLQQIQFLGQRTGLTIKVLVHEFCHERRSQYINETCASLEQMNGCPKVVFLDPDTGIEPQQAGPTHVSISEIRQVWQCLRPADWLVLYQHALRRAAWERTQLAKFSKACGSVRGQMYHCRKLAHDVVFFAARKGQT